MTMAPRARMVALTVHVVASVGWLGGTAAFLALGIAGITSDDPQLVRAVYLAAEPVAWLAIVPLSIAALVTGIVQSLGTSWGLFRHYWVVFKLAITIVAMAVLLMYTQTVGALADVAGEPGTDLRQLRTSTFILHSGAALVLLGAATVLAVHKPRGLTRHGWSKLHERRA